MFVELSKMMREGYDLHIVVSKSENSLTVSVLPKSNDGKDPGLMPMSFNGPANMIDEVFLASITEPLKLVNQIVVNTEAFNTSAMDILKKQTETPVKKSGKKDDKQLSLTSETKTEPKSSKKSAAPVAPADNDEEEDEAFDGGQEVDEDDDIYNSIESASAPAKQEKQAGKMTSKASEPVDDDEDFGNTQSSEANVQNDEDDDMWSDDL